MKNIPFVEELVSRAPKIDGWLFTALKPASDITSVSIEIAGYAIDADSLSFYSNKISSCPDEVDVTIVYNAFLEADESIITQGVFIFLENFLGELNFATSIDNSKVVGNTGVTEELIPIEKLKAYLLWRENEFIEKYQGVRHNTENDSHSSLTAELESGNRLLAIINTDLLEWDGKPSHPWILRVELPYDGVENNGMPNTDDYELLNQLEDDITLELKDADGYLNVGRETTNGIRTIYFACKEFRKPSTVLFSIAKKYSGKQELTYEIYKDKYWQSFDRFTPGL
ncbi:DUF695 domain-containing protein [Hymenobacter jeongseonensis]|uniref:DUF695 domain-containing protein n=1 Tax=Hymenobacter jeongseonensis TaxID=2791027 RepID=UPI00293D8092|nr:DUF695 domain-containing protein [Hymenobacter jeongseonensis]